MRGRLLDDRDGGSAPAVAVINETLAQTYWSERGSRSADAFALPEGVRDGEWSAWGPWITIVGIVKDTALINPAQRPDR